MTPHIAQKSVQEFMTFYLHILITDSPRYFDGGEAVKQTILGLQMEGEPGSRPYSFIKPSP